MFATRTPAWSIRSPQSPGRSALVKRSAPAPLQQSAAVELVVEDVDVVELLVVGVGAVLLVVELVEVEEVVGVAEVLLVVLDVEVLEVVGVCEVLDVVVGSVVDVVVPCSVVDVVPGTFAQEFGGGASFRRRTSSLFSIVVPPNLAQ